MPDYSKSQYDQMIDNPAAPAGMRQTASKWEQSSYGPVSPYGPQTMGESAQTWYGGQNVLGTESGFDTAFMERMFTSYDDWQTRVARSRRSDDPNDWLDPYDWLDPEKNSGDVTGVALWDDPDGRFKVGDVVRDGEVLPNKNVYEVYGQEAADLLLGDFMFDRQTKARIFSRSDRSEAYAREVDERSSEWSEEAAGSEQALKYQGDVYREQHDGWLGDWRGDLAVFGGGFTAGAVTAGTIGAAGGSWLGPGALVTGALAALGGGLFGGTTALLNQDQLENQLAHGMVQADYARERYGSGLAFSTQVKTWGGVGMKFLSPVSNTVQGAADWVYGEIGDGEAAFYAVDENGERIAGGMWQAADIGAGLADGVFQFASPGGRVLYMGTMSASVVGGTGELFATGLSSESGVAGFNERTGTWMEHEGAGQVAAALGVVAIDAVQVGVAGAFGKAARLGRQRFSPDDVLPGSTPGRMATVSSRLQNWGPAQRLGVSQRLGRSKVAEVELRDGHKFKFDKDGNLLDKSVAWSTLIAPSEALKFVTVSWRARSVSARMSGALPAVVSGRAVDPSVMARVRQSINGGLRPGKGMVHPDQYYEAALEMAHGSVFSTAVVNGFAEGAEEGVQAILEPLSFGEQIDGMEVGRSFLYGLASGVGMGLGQVNRGASPQQKQESRAKAMWLLRERIPEPQSVDQIADLNRTWSSIWSGASAVEKRRMASISKDESQRVSEIMGVFEKMHTHAAMGSSIAYSAVSAARTAKYEELHRKRNRAVDSSRVLMGRGDGGPMVAAGGYVDPTEYIEDASVQSLNQVEKDLVDISRGLEEKVAGLELRVAEVEDVLASTTDAARRDTLTQELASLQELLDPLPDAFEVSKEIVGRVQLLADQYRGTTDLAVQQQLAEEINSMLLSAKRGQYVNASGVRLPSKLQESARRAVEMAMVRYPGLDAGANVLLLPQVSVVLTELKQDATSYIHQSKLAAMNADHDGDQGVTNNAQVIPWSSLQQLRRGAQYLDTWSHEKWIAEYGSDMHPMVQEQFEKGRKTSFVRVRIDRPDGHKTRVEIAQDALRDQVDNPVRYGIVADAIDGFVADLKKRYVRQYAIFTEAEEIAALDGFLQQLQQGMRDGSVVAEQKFLDTLWTWAGEDLLLLADRTNTPEMSWQQGRLEQMWTEIQTSLAAQAASSTERVSSGAPQTPAQESTYTQGVAREDAATLGATLQLLLDYKNDSLRQSQGLHYSPFYGSAVAAGRERHKESGHQDSVRYQEFVELYANLGSGRFQSALEDVAESDRVEARVLDMLQQILDEGRRQNPEAFGNDHALVMIAMTETVDVTIEGENRYKVNEKENTTVLQLLLQKSIEIERANNKDMLPDSPLAKKLDRLEMLVRARNEPGGSSVTAKRALFEVFADVPMWVLAGRDALGIGAHLTPRQLAKSVAQLDTLERGKQADKWRRLTLKPYDKKHDPPYSIEEFEVGETNSFTLMVDAVIAEANSAPKDMSKRDQRASDKFRSFHDSLRSMLAQHEKRHYERLQSKGLVNADGEMNRQGVLEDLLETNPEIAQMIAEIIPGGSRMGVFSVQDGQVRTANWLIEMLMEEKSEKAELMLFIHSKLAELNVMGGQLSFTKEAQKEHKKSLKKWRKRKAGKRPRLADPEAQQIDPSKLKSRFLQVVYRLIMEDSTGFELERLLDMAEKSENAQEFMEAFNNEPNWTGGQADFFMYFDSMEAWQEDLSKLWTSGGGDAQLQREALDKADLRLKMLAKGFLEQDIERRDEKFLLDDAEAFVLDSSSSSGNAEETVRQLKRARKLAQMYPDYIGYAARDQFLEMVQVGVPAAHEKGKPDEAVAPLGAALMTTNSLAGWSSGFSQETAALTSHSWRKVMANLTGLAKGPVRVMFPDGRYRVIDFGNDLTVIRMLKDPLTRDFAKAVLFPTARDVDANNVMQHYRAGSDKPSDRQDIPLQQLLKDTALGHLLPTSRMGTMTNKQATQFLGMLESNMREAAIASNDKAVREAANNPLTKMLGDFLIAYTHGPEMTRKQGQAERDHLLTNTMTALTMLASKMQKPGIVQKVREALEQKMLEDARKRHMDWSFEGISKDEANLLDGVITNSLTKMYTEQLAALALESSQIEGLLLNPSANLSQSEIDSKNQRLAEIDTEEQQAQSRLDALSSSGLLWDRINQLHPSVQALLNSWTQRVNDKSDLALLAENRKSLLDFLNTGNRINASVGKDYGLLVQKVRKAVYDQPSELGDNHAITDAEWAQLGAIASVWVVQDSAAHISSKFGMVAVKPGKPDAPDPVTKYYDPTWTYLLDALFDNSVLSAADTLVADQANAPQLDVGYDEIAEFIYSRLLSEEHLGQWTPLTVAMSITARKVLDGGSTLGAVQSEGMQPTEHQAAIAASMATFTKPDDSKHLTTTQIVMSSTPDQYGSFQTAADPLEYLKLERHFIKGLEITLPDGTVLNSPEQLAKVSSRYQREPSVESSGYVILHGDFLDHHLDELQAQHGPGDYTINITYVDVDKKPHTPDYVNSIYFDGVGRESYYSTGPGVLSEFIFSTGGMNKDGQQLPLDFASKAGAAFWQQQITEFNKVDQWEKTHQTLAQILAAKTRQAWLRTYSQGTLLLGDQNAIYKLMKMRHVVKGVDPADPSKVKFMWAEEVITAEANGQTVMGGMRKDTNPDGYEVIALSDEVLVALLGNPGTAGPERALTMPSMNLLDVDPFPSLDLDRLKKLGLERLGEEAPVNDTAFTQVAPLSAARDYSDGRGAERVSPVELQVEEWQESQVEIDTGRSANPNLKPEQSRLNNYAAIKDLMRAELAVRQMNTLRVPLEQMRDYRGIVLGDTVLKTVNRVLGPNRSRMIWYHDHSHGYDPVNARLGQAAIQNNFAGTEYNGKKNHPTYQDLVVIDLDTVLAASANMDEAVDKAIEAFRAYARVGATIMLGSKTNQLLRGLVVQRIKEDSGSDYRSVAGSSHFFQPVTKDSRHSKNVAALESLSTEVRYVTPDEQQYRFMSDFFGTFASENSVMLDLDNAEKIRFKRIVNVIIPSALGTYGEGRFMWNLPFRGDGAKNQMKTEGGSLLHQLDKPEVVKQLKKLSDGKGKYGKDGNPTDVPLIQFDAAGKIANDGVLSFDMALDRFKGHLRSGTSALDPGQTMLPGDFYLVLRNDNVPMLLRYGFQIPNEDTLKAQLKTRAKKGGAEPPMRIGIAISSLQEEQTVPPPMRVHRHKPDPMGLKIEGDYDLSVLTKGMQVVGGLKAGYRPMPAKAQPPRVAMNTTNDTRIGSYVPYDPVVGKQAEFGTLNNLQEAFVWSGIDFREDMVKFFFGEGSYTTEQEMLDLWEQALVLLNKWSGQYQNISVQDAAHLLDTRGTLFYAQEYFNSGMQSLIPGLPPLALDRHLGDNANEDVTARIGLIVLTTLMLPNMTTAHIMGTPGMVNLMNSGKNSRVVEMPTIMTDALNDTAFPATRDEMFRRVNANANSPLIDVPERDASGNVVKDASGNVVYKPQQQPAYYLNPDFTFDVMMTGEDGLPMLVKGNLQRITELPYAKESASISASQLKQRQDSAPHTVNVAAETIGAWSVVGSAKEEGKVNPLEALLEGKNQILYFNDPDQSFHQIFARVRGAKEFKYSPWDRRLPLQQEYLRTAMEKMNQYRRPIDKSTWKTGEADRAAKEVLRKLGLGDDQMYEIDIMVRQWLGAPGATQDETEFVINEQDYAQAASLMLENLNNNMQPLHGAMVPMPSESLWAKVYKAQEGRKAKDKWTPELKKGWRKGQVEKADGWDSWLITLFGQVNSSMIEFNHMFRTDTDGFMHGYQGMSSTFADLPISLDTQREMELMDPDVNHFVLSIDPGTDDFFSSPIVLETMRYTLYSLTGHDKDIITQRDARAVPSSTIAERLAHQQKWLKGKGGSKQKKQAYRDYYREGAVFLETSERTANFIRNLNHLQIVNRLAVPALWVSSVPEMFVKTQIEQMTDIISRGGRVTSPQSRQERIDRRKLLNRVAGELGGKTEWKAMLYGEMLYDNLLQRGGPAKLSQWLEKSAGTMARLTGDARLGMSGKPAAKRYIAAALEWLESTDNNITVEQLAVGLMRDPLWLEKQFPAGRTNPHTVAVNAVAQTRGAKQSLLNKTAFGWIDQLERSESSMALQILGFILNVPFKFKRFNVGTFLSMTGMGWLDTLFAMGRDARPRNTIMGRMQAAMKGEPYVPGELIDHSDVLATLDLTREVSKGALTQTMLLAAGMFAGNLDLDGEDEESKRRRRLAEYLNGPYLYDPRKMQNDFRYADALFVDNLGPLEMMYMDVETGRSVIKPHWIIQQFTSPVMGIQRFLRTGNIAEIGFGFTDAISVIPTSALNILRNARVASEQLTAEAADLSAMDMEGNQDRIVQTLINIAAAYEGALFENSTVNAIRTAKDRFDRDPYAVAATNDIGQIERTNGLPNRAKETEQFRATTVDENGEVIEGEVQEGYVNRPLGGAEGARSVALAENRFTYSLVASLITGNLFTGNSPFARRNMPVKERKVEVPEVGQEDAEQLLLAGLRHVGTEPELTFNEMVFLIKGRYEEAGLSWEQAAVEEEAKATLDAMGMDGRVGGLFALGADNQVVIQHEGARGIYKALWSGQVRWDDEVMLASLPPISYETRVEIAKEWIQELMQYGVDMGMSQQGAEFYARRIYYGDNMDPSSVALSDVIWDDRIPYSGTLKYNQLNMTYMLGPDGRPWATPFTKDSVMQALGMPMPTSTPRVGDSTGMSRDARGASVDLVSGINTGLMGLERQVEPEREPPDPFDNVEPVTPSAGTARRSYRRGGGGGSYTPYYKTPEMRPLPRGTGADSDFVPAINTNNPYIRRANVNRQRITTQRGRLKQWQ